MLSANRLKKKNHDIEKGYVLLKYACKEVEYKCLIDFFQVFNRTIGGLA